jgi:hypothetical protein
MASIAQKKNVCSQKDVDVAVGRYLRVSISSIARACAPVSPIIKHGSAISSTYF